MRVVRFGDAVLDATKKLHQVECILSHPLLANGKSNEGGAFHSLGAQQTVLLRLLLLQNVEEKWHQSVVVVSKRSLCGVGDGRNGGQSLLLHEALRALQKHEQVAQKLVEVWLKDVLLSLLAEVDKGSGCMGLYAGFRRLQYRDDVGQNDLVVLALHCSCKVSAHLTDSVASSPAHTRVGIAQSRDDEVQDLVKFSNHQVPASLRNGRDSHKSCMPISPR